MDLFQSKAKDFNWLSLFGVIREKEDKEKFYVPDDKAEICFKCLSKFSLLFRRHHCYICGNVFCKNCLNKIIQLTESANSKTIKVCEYCHSMSIEFSIIMTQNIYFNQAENTFQTKLEEFIESYYSESSLNTVSVIGTIETNYDKLLKILVKKQMKEIFPNQNKFNMYEHSVYLLTKMIINNIRISTDLLHDSQDIIQYIKIITRGNKPQNSFRIINGFITKNNLISPRMRRTIKNPRIILIRNSLSAKRLKNSNEPYDCSIEPIYLTNAKKKFDLVNPDIIICEGIVCDYIKEIFTKANISVIMNVKPKTIDRIARCTRCVPLPSFDLISENTIVGKCGEFRIEDDDMMIFDGCDEKLFATIVLEGENENDFKLIKAKMTSTILPTARDLFLQMNMRYMFNSATNTEICNEDDVDNLFIRENAKNFSGFDTTLITRESTPFTYTKVSIYNRNIHESSTEEDDYKDNYDFICDSFSNITHHFYSYNFSYDMPLGLYITRKCELLNSPCDKCGKKRINHIYDLYRGASRIRITYSKIPKNDFPNKDNEIYTYGYCKICETSKQIVLFSKIAFNYSYAKFIKDMFELHCLKNYDGICSHILNRDIERVFVYKNYLIKFGFSKVEKYSQMKHMLVPAEKIVVKNLRDEFLLDAFNVSIEMASLVVSSMKKKNSNIISIKDDDSINLNLFNDMQKSIINLLSSHISSISDFKEKIIIPYLFEKKFQASKNSVSPLVYVRKIYMKIFEYKILHNQIENLIDKFLRLLYGIITQREMVTSFTIYIKKAFFAISAYKQVNPSKNEEELSDLNEVDLENNESYKKILKNIYYYDNDHSKYANEISEDDISSIISYALSSDSYANFTTIKKEKEISLNSIKRKSASNSNDMSHGSSLMFDIGEVAFWVENGNFDIVHILEEVILSNDNENFSYEISDNIIRTKLIELSKEYEKKNNLMRATANSFPKLNKNGSLNIKKLSNSLTYKNRFGNYKKDIKNNEEKDDFNEFENSISTLMNDIFSASLMYSQFKASLIASLNIPKNELHIRKEERYRIEKKTILNQIRNEIKVIVYFPKQFEAIRIAYCATYNEFITSLSQSIKWVNVSGGKSNANFSKSLDSKYILKSITKYEFEMFVSSSQEYFSHMAKYLFHKEPSALAKILGVYKVKSYSPQTKKVTKNYIVLMENIFYGINNSTSKAYDLKGSRINRYIPKKKQQIGQVLPDLNFKEDFKASPIPIDAKVYNVFKRAIENDTLMLSNINVVDYSLLVVFTEERLFKIGILDYMRKYTWDKQLEHIGKSIMNKFENPTIVNPEDYRKRFMKELFYCFIGI